MLAGTNISEGVPTCDDKPIKFVKLPDTKIADSFHYVIIFYKLFTVFEKSEV